MPQIKVDRTVCSGYANCVSAAPDVFDLGDDDLVVVLRADITADDLDAVQDAVNACPTGALELVGEDA